MEITTLAFESEKTRSYSLLLILRVNFPVKSETVPTTTSIITSLPSNTSFAVIVTLISPFGRLSFIMFVSTVELTALSPILSPATK